MLSVAIFERNKQGLNNLMKKPTPNRVVRSPQAVPKLNSHSKAVQALMKRAGIKQAPLVKTPARQLVQKKTVNSVRTPIQTSAPERTIQCFPSRVVQAVKFYPNLHPGAIEPVDPNNVFRLRSFAGQYRLHRQHSHGVNVPNQQYNFVRTREGEMLLHNRYRHPSIAEGKQVLYAGEIFFNNGTLQWWSNGSGHYQPYAEDAEQASLPMDYFFSYQQIIKGEHKRKKS